MVPPDELAEGAAGDADARQVRVLCSLSLPAGVRLPPGERVTVHLAIDDVSLADAAATTVAHADVVVGDDGEVEGPYTLDANLTPGREFALTAHVDASGDGSVAPGDLLTTTRVTVPTDEDQVLLEVPVTRV